MADNQRHLRDGRAHIRQFEVQMEPERLREAYIDFENVVLGAERDPRARVELRRECLTSWLELLDVLDRFVDPGFDINDLPELRVEPPPTRGGIRYPPGADPAVIDDPKARSDYEQAIAASREKAIRFRLQVQLARLNDRIPAAAIAFVRQSYSADTGDQTELRAAINTVIRNPKRKAELLSLTAPEHR